MHPILELAQKMVRGEEPPPPIGRLLGFKLKAIEPGRAVFEMAVDERHHNPLGTLHGGVYCDLADGDNKDEQWKEREMSIANPGATPETEAKGHLDRNYLLVLPLCLVLFIAFTGFAEGFRLPGWVVCKPAAIWMAYPLLLSLLCWLGARLIASPSRKLLWRWSILLVLTLALFLGGYRAIERLGRTLVQREVSTTELANDCRRLIAQEVRAVTDDPTLSDGRPLAPEEWPASIRRMRPTSVTVGRDRIRLELHGGFDHYGYILERAAEEPSWRLEWYDEGNIREILVTLPSTE
jgi:hypothetical protein